MIGVQMQIKHVGPKTLISTQGVSFSTKKKDKYIYLSSLLQLIEAIDHDYVEDRVHTYMLDSRELTNDEIISAIKQYCPDFETIITKAKEAAEAYIEDKLTRAANSIHHNEEEIRVLINNITLMRDYTIQRHINKCIYYDVVNTFIDLLRHTNIAYISAPAQKTFFHVLHTVQRTLRQRKTPVNSQLTFHKEGEALFIKLHVVNF